MGNLQVMVIGAGTGGLALAHGLRASGIAVRVFERDDNLTERSQGYRLTINVQGARALPVVLWLRFGAGAMPYRFSTFPIVWSETLWPRLARTPAMRS